MRDVVMASMIIDPHLSSRYIDIQLCSYNRGTPAYTLTVPVHPQPSLSRYFCYVGRIIRGKIEKMVSFSFNTKRSWS